MPKATFNGVVLAESDHTEMVEGNHYFPSASVNQEYFTPTDHSTRCPWKGEANYYSITVDGETKANAAWYYPEPKDAAANIKDHIAFYGAVVTIEA